jgi:hypothetical protein
MDTWAKPGTQAATKSGQKRTGRDTTNNDEKKPRLPADDLKELNVQTVNLALATATTTILPATTALATTNIAPLHQDASASTVSLEHSSLVDTTDHDEARSPVSTSSAENSPVIPWAEFFAARPS